MYQLLVLGVALYALTTPCPLLSRTARGFECGTALTFVCPTEEVLLHEVEERLSSEQGVPVSVCDVCLCVFVCVCHLWKHLFCCAVDNETESTTVKPYVFKMSEIEGFRYRVTVSIIV